MSLASLLNSGHDRGGSAIRALAACTPAGLNNDGNKAGGAEAIGGAAVGTGEAVETEGGHGGSGFTVTVTGPKQTSHRVPVVLAQTWGSIAGAGPIVISGWT